jgi:pepF/M3 family oligoendopeptidase
MAVQTQTPPRWDLSNVYPSLDSAQLAADLKLFPQMLAALKKEFDENAASLTADSDPAVLSVALNNLVDQLNALITKTSTIRSYLNSFVSTDSFNKQALKMVSEFELATVPMQQFNIKFELWLGKVAAILPKALELPGSARRHAFFLIETAEQSKYRMSDPEENLVAELNLSGTNAWGKLQGTITSQLSVDLEFDGKIQKLSMPALINLHGHPDESVRQRAYEAEMNAWTSVREPLAASMNGIKGTVNTLNRRRGRKDALHKPIEDARIDEATLEALLGAMQDSFPKFRHYFLAKAARLGKEKLAWWDVFAPMGKLEKTYTFDQARDFILTHFGAFSPDLENLARRAFDNSWIDAEQRVGKRGGAFCMSLYGVGESRVLCNFDNSLDQVFTIAHELGHAFHNDCMVRAGKTPLQRSSPMTLAETASIMCETIANHAALSQAASPQEELAILETSLIGSSQVIVDIYSRYLFEKEVFERRAKSELSADDFCDIMERAQKATYGEGLDERYLHKYMWTWKPHYYSAGLSFYNFPYAFGLLFGLGLYAIYQQRGSTFVPEYTNLLASTGENRAAELANRFGIDIRKKDFWAESLNVIGRQIDRYVQI